MNNSFVNEIIPTIAQRLKKSKPLSKEFADVIEENFWDLIETDNKK